MTNELEKQFFDTFGIKPKIRFHCANSQPCAHTGFHCKGCTYHSKDVIYPQITDRILLKLICILSKYQKDRGSLLEIDKIKEEILEMLIYRVDGCKHQVRTLFEEE